LNDKRSQLGELRGVDFERIGSGEEVRRKRLFNLETGRKNS